MKKIPIGYSDFKRIRSTAELLYVDKTDLISEFVEDQCMVLLITRPRRFGKTLNLSTLRYFFDQENALENRKLFDGLKVSQNKKTMALQGSRPVINLSFKDCKTQNWHNMQSMIHGLFAKTSEAFQSYFEQGTDPSQRALRAIFQKNASYDESCNFLFHLSFLCQKNTNLSPLILIDEYDVPLQSAWAYNYWDEAITFFRNFFSAAFKDNPYLWRGVITGCLRVARESMFTGMNNLEVSSVSSKSYSKHFGFTIPEVKQLIQDYNLGAIEAKIESWYNGYRFGETTIYNPWSILNLLKNEGEFRPYWINTSGNDLVKEILSRSGVNAKKDLEDLMTGKTITVPLQEQVVFQEIENSPANLWNFLYFTGYLKAVSTKETDESLLVELKIPNKEVKRIFSDSIQLWFQHSESSSLIPNLKSALMLGDVTEISKALRKLCDTSLSYFDATGKEPEKFYHGLVLGLMTYFSDTWHIRSNRESGLGRCDLLMTPKNRDHYGIVMEFKTMDSYEDSDLVACAQNAMTQIEKRQYEQELMSQGATKILKMGIGFLGKKLEILCQINQGT